MLRSLQGAGGGGGGGGSHSHDSSSGGGGGGSVSTGALIGIIAGVIIFALLYCFCHSLSKRKATSAQAKTARKQDTWIARKRAAIAGAPTANVAPGKYVGCYKQYNRLHVVPGFTLSIDHSTNEVNGRGTDDVGTYFLVGEMAGKYVSLKKTYVLGTGNRRENKGHTVFMKLEYGKIPDTLPTPGLSQLLSQNGMGSRPLYWFSGTWHVAASTYSGSGKTYFWQTQQQQQQGALEASAVADDDQVVVPIATLVDEPALANVVKL